MSCDDFAMLKWIKSDVVLRTDTSVVFCLLHDTVEEANLSLQWWTRSFNLSSTHASSLCNRAHVQAVTRFARNVLQMSTCGSVQASNAHVFATNDSVKHDCHKSSTVAVSIVLNAPDFKLRT